MMLRRRSAAYLDYTLVPIGMVNKEAAAAAVR